METSTPTLADLFRLNPALQPVAEQMALTQYAKSLPQLEPEETTFLATRIHERVFGENAERFARAERAENLRTGSVEPPAATPPSRWAHLQGK